MKTRFVLFFTTMLLLGWSITSCHCKGGTCPFTKQKANEKAEVVLKDYGAEPTVLDIDAYAMANEDFRTALWTGTLLQVTLMSIPVGGEVGLEQHNETDQFLRIEDGQAEVLMGDTKEALTFNKTAEKDFAIIIPAGKWHNIINTGDKPLKLYSIYAPVQHPHSTVHKTFEEAEEAEHQH